MPKLLAAILAAFGIAWLGGVIIWLVLLPRLDWSAVQPPGAIEQTLAHNVLIRWVERNADTETNPLMPTPENLTSARTEYKAHCSACHGLDGSGTNEFEANFYPPVAKLTGGAGKFSDAEIYFIIANGIRYTAMPAFGRYHSSEDMWRLVLWVRHLANLTPAEKAAIESQMSGTVEKHHQSMIGDGPSMRHAN